MIFDELIIFNWLMIIMIVIGVIVFITLFYITAGYGKFISKKFGPAINNKVGWIIMEIPTVIIYVILFTIGEYKTITTILFLLFWLMHYGYRSIIFSILIRGKSKMPLSIIAMGVLFNSINAYLQGRWINTFSLGYDASWLLTPMFIVGVILFFTGFLIHVNSDNIIRTLRKPGETEHKIPHRGLFRYISCPNYLGEILEWLGWAIMTWSMPGLVFALWTIFNLVPRAISSHQWYLKKFEDYPKNRKALIPFLL